MLSSSSSEKTAEIQSTVYGLTPPCPALGHLKEVLVFLLCKRASTDRKFRCMLLTPSSPRANSSSFSSLLLSLFPLLLPYSLCNTPSPPSLPRPPPRLSSLDFYTMLSLIQLSIFLSTLANLSLSANAKSVFITNNCPYTVWVSQASIDRSKLVQHFGRVSLILSLRNSFLTNLFVSCTRQQPVISNTNIGGGYTG